MRYYAFASVELEPDFLSRSIMQALDCKWSHNGIIYCVDDNDSGTIVHSIGKGVCEEPVREFLISHKFVHFINVTSLINDHGFAKGWLKGSIGKDYSESQYLGFLFPRIKKLVSDGKAEMICSEFAARFMCECTSFKGFDEANCDFIDPKIFIETLRKEFP
jgi:hypothetical protein